MLPRLVLGCVAWPQIVSRPFGLPSAVGAQPLEVEAVSSSRLETIVKHDGRLNLLCCLLDGGPLSVPQIAARIGESLQAVRYWIGLLDAFSLVEKHAGMSGGETLYSATLDRHPEWVREAVAQHRPRALD